MLTEQRLRAVASHALGLEVLRRATWALRPLGVYAMPLKGVWLQSWVYERPDERAISDVDVIVPEAAFVPAARALLDAGFVRRSSNASEAAFELPGAPLPVDVHARLFMPGAFALPTHALFARASAPVEIEGARVVLPDPLDALCHLVGHLVKSRHAPDDPVYTRDFCAVVERFSLSAPAIARRLDDAGMARAARYAFADVAARDPTFAQALGALPRDAAGEWLARACVRARSLEASEVPLGTSRLGRAARALPGFVLERSLPAAGRALLLRAVSLSADRDHT